MKKILGFLLICVFLVGCGEEKEVEEITEENNGKEIITTEESEETEEIENKENEEINVIFHKDYEVDGEKVTISLDEIEDNLKVVVYGEANTEEKASLLLTTFSADMKEINYSISVKCKDLFMLTTSEGMVSGINRDGSMSFSAPDWYGFSNNVDLTEELKDYIQNVQEVEKDFLEEIQDLNM